MTDWVPVLETALYDANVVARDQATQDLFGHLEPPLIEQLVAALDSTTRLTRRRAGRILSGLPIKHTHPVARIAIGASTTPDRVLIGLARVMTATSASPEPTFSHGLTHSNPAVRRAFATAAAPTRDLVLSLADQDEEVVSRAAQICLTRDIALSSDDLDGLMSVSVKPAALIRFVASQSDGQSVLKHWGEMGHRALLEYTADEEILLDQFDVEPAFTAWAYLAQGHSPPVSWAAHSDHRVRAALARYVPDESPILSQLSEDNNATVRWFAQQRRAGQYTSVALDGRHGLGERLASPSLDPPYGLREGDTVPQVPRVHAALAICQARFDINLGVAVRSAEAAGFQEVFFVGRGDYLKSPARGADLAIPVRQVADPAALIRYARNADYQLVAVQQTASSVPYHTAVYPPRPLFIVGSEDVGMPNLLRSRADLAVEIPQYGVIDSLNVAAASTVVMFHWRVHHGPTSGVYLSED